MSLYVFHPNAQRKLAYLRDEPLATLPGLKILQLRRLSLKIGRVRIISCPLNTEMNTELFNFRYHEKDRNLK